MNRAIDATAAQQRIVRRIDDGVDVQRGDVGLNQFEVTPLMSISYGTRLKMSGLAFFTGGVYFKVSPLHS